jgi:hypothetical protein
MKTKKDNRVTKRKTLLVRKKPIEDKKERSLFRNRFRIRNGNQGFIKNNFLTSIKSKKPTAFADFVLPPFPLIKISFHSQQNASNMEGISMNCWNSLSQNEHISGRKLEYPEKISGMKRS